MYTRFLTIYHTQIINRQTWCTFAQQTANENRGEKKKISQPHTELNAIEIKRDGNQFASSWFLFVRQHKRVNFVCASYLTLIRSDSQRFFLSYRRLFRKWANFFLFLRFNFNSTEGGKEGNNGNTHNTNTLKQYNKRTNNLFCNQKIIYHNNKKKLKAILFIFGSFVSYLGCKRWQWRHHNW